MVYQIEESRFEIIPTISGRAAVKGSRIYSVYAGITRYTDDYGETYVDLQNNLPAYSQDYYVHIAKSGTMIVSKTRQVFRSVYPYTNFTNVVNLSTTGSYINTWGFTEDSDGVLYLSEYGNYKMVGETSFTNVLLWYKSTNDGLSWTKYTNLQDKDTKHIHQIKVNPYTQVLYATTGDAYKRLFKSHNKGENWEEVIPTNFPDKTSQNINYGGFTGVGFYPDGTILWGTDWQPTNNGTYWNWHTKSKGHDVNSFTYKKMEKRYYGFSGEIVTDPTTGEAWNMVRDEFGEDDVVSAVMYSQDYGNTWTPLVETPTISTMQMGTILRTEENFIPDFPYIFLDVMNHGVVRFPRNLKPIPPPVKSDQIKTASFYQNINGEIVEVDIFYGGVNLSVLNVFLGE